MNQRKYERYRRQQQSEYGTGRRIFAIVLALLFFFGTIVLSMTWVFGEEDEALTGAKGSGIPVPDTKCETVLLVDRTTGEVLYDKNGHTPRTPASITKIMTCVLILENCEMDEEVTVTKESVFDTDMFPDGSHMDLKAGEVVTVKDLINGLMVCSANDAAFALAIHLDGDVETFVKRMNDKAAELGMNDTHYLTPNGFTESFDHITTAYDLAILTDYALDVEGFRDIVSQSSYNVSASNLNEARKVKSTNLLLQDKKTDIVINGVERHPKYAGAFGVKTGMMGSSMYCLDAGAKRGDTELLCICLYGEEPIYRYEDAVAMFDYGFSNYRTLDLMEPGAECGKVKVKGGHKTRVQTTCPEGAFVTAKITEGNGLAASIADAEEDGADISLEPEAEEGAVPTDKAIEDGTLTLQETSYEIVLNDDVTAPVKEGDVVGRVDVYRNGEVVSSSDVAIAESVEEGGPWTNLYIPDSTAYLIMTVLGLFILLLLVRRYNKAKARRRRAAKHARQSRR